MNPRMRVYKLAFSWDIVSQKFKIKLGKQHRQTVCWHQFARDKWPVFSSGKANDEPTIQSCEDVDKQFQVEFIIWFSRITRRASSKLVCKTNHRPIYQQKPTKKCDITFSPTFRVFWVLHHLVSGWWFGTFFIFHNIWDNPSHWLIFSRWLKPPTRCAVSEFWINWLPLGSAALAPATFCWTTILLVRGPTSRRIPLGSHAGRRSMVMILVFIWYDYTIITP